MGFDPRRWRPSSGSRPLTTNVEALLAENDALRREVRSLRLQLEALLQGNANARDSWSWDPSRVASEANAAAASQTPRQRVTVGSSHGLSADLVERWGHALACHPRWQELRIGLPGGLRGLEQELRRHWWNPALSLEEELDRRSPGLGGELSEALRGPHSRVRWAVRAAFALYGPRAPEWLSEDPLRVVEELLRRVRQLERQGDGSPSSRRGTRTANHSGGAAGSGASRSAGRSTDAGTTQDSERQADAGRRAGASSGGSGPRNGSTGQTGHRHGRGAGSTAQEQAAAGSQRASARQAPPRDPRTQALAELGLEAGASPAAIKRAYRRLAKAHHPDLGGDAEAFRRLDAAYRSLL